VELLLVRHGQAQRVDNDPNGADPSLSERGRLQAGALAEHLSVEDVDALWASPMQRARQTAEALALATGHTVQIDDRLAEFDRNHSSYHPPDPGAMTAEAIQAALDGMKDPAFAAAVASVIDHLVAEHPGQRVAVVCHGGVIRQALAHLFGLPQLIDQTLVDYTSISRILVNRQGRVALRGFNEAPWLRLAPFAT
jgi:probable phosphoglycerate mutase